MDDCLIVGGGAVGLSAAYELAAAGLKVHVLERGEPGHEASWAGAGILPAARRSGGTPYEQLSRLSYGLHSQWAEQLKAETGIDNGLTHCGEIHIARSPEAVRLLEGDAQKWRDGELEVDGLSEPEVLQREPALRGDTPRLPSIGNAGVPPILAAYGLPGAAQIRNPRHLRALLLACQRRGVRITGNAEVQELKRNGARVEQVVSTQGSFSAGRIVLCAGAWTQHLLQQLESPAALKPIRGQIALLRLPKQIFRSVIHEGSHYLVPREDGRVLVGSTLEDVGFDKRTTSEAIAELLAFAGSLVPALAVAEVERCWAGLRPGSLLPFPLIGPVPGCDNVLVAAGHFRWGLYLSPGTAVLLRQMILGQPTEIDPTVFQYQHQNTQG